MSDEDVIVARLRRIQQQLDIDIQENLAKPIGLLILDSGPGESTLEYLPKVDPEVIKELFEEFNLEACDVLHKK